MNKYIVLFFIAHVALGVAGTWLVELGAFGIAESGESSVPTWLGSLDIVTRYVLLQPAGRWTLAWLDAGAGTWGGLLRTLAAVSLNSLLVTAIAVAAIRLLRGRAGSQH